MRWAQLSGGTGNQAAMHHHAYCRASGRLQVPRMSPPPHGSTQRFSNARKWIASAHHHVAAPAHKQLPPAAPQQGAWGTGVGGCAGWTLQLAKPGVGRCVVHPADGRR